MPKCSDCNIDYEGSEYYTTEDENLCPDCADYLDPDDPEDERKEC